MSTAADSPKPPADPDGLQQAAAGLGDFDKVLEHRVRLAICTLLARTDAINFARFKTVLEQTDGSLGAQLRRLEDAGYVDVDKRFEQRKPVSWYSLTPQGRSALEAHVAALQGLIGPVTDST